MLNKLSRRNARRQAEEYLLFIATMSGTAAIIYSFNSLIFSDAVTRFLTGPSGTASVYLTLMISLFSVVIVIIMGWFVSYMMNFMLRKRAKELSTYMILGVENAQIIKMYLTENSLIGAAALIVGLGLGLLIAEFLGAMLAAPFGVPYVLTSGFSLAAIGLTVFYFGMIYLFAMFRCRRKLRKMQLIMLLHYDRQNEKAHIKKAGTAMLFILIAVLFGVGGFCLFFIKPIGNPLDGYGLDIFLGMIMIIVCLFVFFQGLPAAVHSTLGKNKNWKYRKENLVVYRLLTAKINNMGYLFGWIAVVYTLVLTVFGTALTFNVMMQKTLALEVYDITVLHMDEKYDFTEYDDYFTAQADIKFSYSYTLYTDYKKDFMEIRNQNASSFLERVGSFLEAEIHIFKENQYDTYMKYSDYCILREKLQLDPVAMDDNEFMIHCMPYLRDSFQEYTSGGRGITPKGLVCTGIYTEEFSQYSGYGNGQEYILIIPDQLADLKSVLYSLYAANTAAALPREQVNALPDRFGNLQFLKGSALYSAVRSDDSGYLTMLTDDSGKTDYIGGKMIDGGTGENLTVILPLFYLSLILCMIATVILAVHLLSENQKFYQHYNMISVMGLDQGAVKRVLRRQLLIYFCIPALPALMMGGALIFTVAEGLISKGFHSPVFLNITVPVTKVIMITIVLFIIIYGIYTLVTYTMLKNDIVKKIFR